MKKTLTILFILVLATVALVQNTQAAVRYVTTTGAGLNDGTSWANAYIGLQAALSAASSGDQIWVAAGTYYPSSAYDLTNTSRYYHFRMINGVAIYGGFVGNEAATNQRTNYGAGEAHETILSGEIGAVGIADNCYHVFYHPTGLGLTSSAILDGFTISGGNADGSSPHNIGGGVYNSSSPTFTNCIFSSNSASYGGGVYNSSSSSTYTNCTFSSNSASGGTSPSGGGVYNSSSSPTLTNCTFSLNEAAFGGGVFNKVSSSPTFTNCIFSSNSTYFNGAGGGIYNHQSSPNLINCTISLNSAAEGGNGGGIYNYSSSSPTLKNCVIWGNMAVTANQFYVESGTTTLNYSCYGNGSNDVFVSGIGTFTATIDDCITTDPKFVDETTSDFRIVGDSPCADAGNDSYNSQSFDIRGTGYARKLSKVDGSPGTIDIGAYEYQFGTDPLPVELTSFSALVAGTNVNLNWQTATEVNNYGFQVQRTKDKGQSEDEWEDITFVQGNGTTNSPKEYSFTDSKLPNADEVSYRLKQIDNDGTFAYSKTVTVDLTTITSVNDDKIPIVYSLSQNYPNPFNPCTTIKFGLPERGFVDLRVFNMLGQEVAQLLNKEMRAGYHEVNFDASNLSSGVYLYRIQTSSGFVSTKRLMLLK